MIQQRIGLFLLGMCLAILGPIMPQRVWTALRNAVLEHGTEL